MVDLGRYFLYFIEGKVEFGEHSQFYDVGGEAVDLVMTEVDPLQSSHCFDHWIDCCESVILHLQNL